MKVIFTFFIFFASLTVIADDTVRITAPKELVVPGFTTSTFNLNVDKPSGDATADTGAARVYVPISRTTPADHDLYFSQYKTGVTKLFMTNDATNVIKFPLTTTVTGTKYLFVAAKLSTGTGYKVVKKYIDSVLNGSQEIAYFNVPVSTICDQYPTDCAPILPTSTSNSKVTFTLYFFISPSNLALGDPVVPSTSTGGVYFEVVLSNRIYLNTELKVFITNPRKGDKRILMDYSSDSAMTDFKKIVVFKHSVTPDILATNKPIGDAGYTGAIIDHEYSTSQADSLVVNDLTNGAPVTLSVAFMDKFGFLSTLSDDITEQPTEIQELLKKQACYILTAGFGEEHYVTNYFRSYRDHVLANSWIGRKFIKFYYKTAPHYAVIIYNHQLVRLGIRGLAYLLYFLFNFGWLVLIFLAACSCIDNLRKNKILMRNNRL